MHNFGLFADTDVVEQQRRLRGSIPYLCSLGETVSARDNWQLIFGASGLSGGRCPEKSIFIRFAWTLYVSVWPIAGFPHVIFDATHLFCTAE